MLKHLFLILTATALLMACSQEPESESASEAPAQSQTESNEAADTEVPEGSDSTARAETALESLAEDPTALREAMRDPEQRTALIEAMRERREARRAERGMQDNDVEREAVREQMRQRREQIMAGRNAEGADARTQMQARMLERNRWWSNDAIRSSIGLSDAQAEALTQAQIQIETQRQTVRGSIGQNQRELMDAIRSADRSRILELAEQRSRNQQALQNLELEWWRTMLDQLSDEQLATLAEENPQVLMRRLRR